MKTLLPVFVFLLTLTPSYGNAQTWQTIPEWGTYARAPYGQFLINPYTNDIWINSEDQVSVIKNDGTIIVFNNGELGSLYIGDNLQFAFTPQHVYYAHDYTALYSFDNYTPQAEFIFNSFQQTEYKSLSSNGDTVYVGFNTSYGSTDFQIRKHALGNTTIGDYYAKKVIAVSLQGMFTRDDQI